MSDDDHAKLKAKTAQEKTTIQELLSKYVQNYLSAPKDLMELDYETLHDLALRAQDMANDLAAIEKIKGLREHYSDEK